MRKSMVVCVLMIGLWLLSACGGGGNAEPMEQALAIRGEYLTAGGCTAQVRVTADYGQRVYDYVLDVLVTGQDTEIRVCEPVELAGLTARLQAGESMLQYDDAVLETGSLTQDGLTPISAVSALLEAAKSGFIDGCGTEGETLYILCRDPAELPGCGREIGLWFHGANHGLLRGEVSVDGRRIITCEFIEFTLK